tara:strand:- start:256 stop:648 length:393 start_codon:yes stop_codon:yes gene_type:complete
MFRIFLFIFFFIISNNSIASVQGETLICDDDRRGYNFISKDKVEISIVNLNDLNIVSLTYLYELAENVIFIKQPETEFNKTKMIGWIFRRNLDYVSLYYERGDLSRKFSWSCEITSLKELETRLNNKLNK